MIHPAQSLIDEITRVDVNNQSDLLNFARFCKKYQDKIDVDQIHPYLNYRRDLEGKDQKDTMEIGVDEKVSFRMALITDYLQNNKNADGDALNAKIKAIDNHLYEALSKAPRMAIDGIIRDDPVHGEVTAMMTAFENVKYNKYQFPPVADDPLLEPIGEYLSIERAKAEKAEKAEKAIELIKGAELKVDSEIKRLSATEASKKGAPLIFASRAGSAISILQGYNDDLKKASEAIKILDPGSKDFHNQLDKVLITLSHKTEACYNQPAIKRSPSTHKIFQWILDGLTSLGLYQSKAAKAADTAKQTIDELVSVTEQQKLYGKVEREAVQALLKLDKKISSLESELDFVRTDKGKKIATIDEALGSMPRTPEIVTAEIDKAKQEKIKKLDDSKVQALYESVKDLDSKPSSPKLGR